MHGDGATVSIRLEELAERLDLWCDFCLLPSRAEWDLMVMINNHMDHIVTFSYCTDCERESWSGTGAA
jgi:hypothetical protein